MRPALVLALALAAAACVIPMNHEQIAAQNAQHYQRLCSDQNYAYETGFNTGAKRKPLDTAWVDTTCAPEWRPAIRSSYQNGYQAGIANAPIVVPIRAGVVATVESCRFSSDCGEGRTCRQQQCMGQGYAGDACWFSSDCLSDSCDVAAKVCR